MASERAPITLEPRRASAGQAAASGPRAMSRVLRLFDLLAARRGGMSLSEASEALGVPKSTLLGSLKALVADGFLVSEGGSYLLGPGTYRLAGAIMAGWSMPDLVRPYVRGLSEATRESVGFGIVDWEIGQIIYTDAVNSPQPVHYAMRVGVRAPLYASAAGRVLLAFAPEERVAEYLRRTRFKPLTDSTLTTAEQLKEQLVEVRKLGYCASFGELLKDSGAVAAPVFDPRGEVVGALMVGAPLERMRDNLEALLSAVRSFGRQASGFNPDDEPLAAA
jgi:DNA-binding IclR family transcriptional regulator